MIKFLLLFVFLVLNTDCFAKKDPFSVTPDEELRKKCLLLEKELNEEIYHIDTYSDTVFDRFEEWDSLSPERKKMLCHHLSKKDTKNPEYSIWLMLDEESKKEICLKYQKEKNIIIKYDYEPLENIPAPTSWKAMNDNQKLSSCKSLDMKNIKSMDEYYAGVRDRVNKMREGKSQLRQEFINSPHVQNTFDEIINAFEETRKRTMFDRIYDSSLYTFSGGLIGEKNRCDLKEICDENKNLYEKFKGVFANFKIMMKEDEEKEKKFVNSSIDELNRFKNGE